MDAILAQVNALKNAEGDELAKLTESLSAQLKSLKLEKVFFIFLELKSTQID